MSEVKREASNRQGVAAAAGIDESNPASQFLVPVEHQKKIMKHKYASHEALDHEIAKFIYEIREATSQSEMKAALARVQVLRTKEIDVGDNKKATVVFFPYKIYQMYVKPHLSRLITELEKKAKTHVIFIAQRQMQPKIRGSNKPRSMRLTAAAVKQAMLEDIVAPADVVGKRLRIEADGKRTYTIYLDPKDKGQDVMDKFNTYSKVYQSLTWKTVVFKFP